MNEKDCIMKGYDIEATNALLSNGMAEDIDDDVSSINLKKEESFVHMTDENTFNPLVTAGSLKVNDVVYDESTNHKHRVIDVKDGNNSWTKTITWKDLDDNRIFTTNPGVNALYELQVDGDMEFEVDDDIEFEFHPIDTYFENFTEDMGSVTNEEIRLDVVNNVIDALHDMGYDDDFIGSYVHIEVKDTEDGRVKVEVRGEFNYEELSELTDRLNKVVSKYDKYAYFDMEDSGIASAYILKDQSDYVIKEEVVKAVSELIDTCETKEDLKKVYIEHIRPFAENDVINTATFDEILNIFDKKLDVLVDDETVNEEVHVIHDDLNLNEIRESSQTFSVYYDDSGFTPKITKEDRSKVTEIVIKDGTTKIKDSAFHDCISLTNIIIPDSVTSIRGYAFYNCRSLTSIKIPSSVTSIGKHAFCNCHSLTSIALPNGVPSIEESTFSNCYSLTNITIPSSVTSIGYGAFGVCRSLTSITLPNSVASIGNSAFRVCSSLTRIKLPNNITSIANSTFVECKSLTNIEIPSSVTNIGDSAFERCSSLATVRIPDGVTSIGKYAFFACSSLANITIPDSVTDIDENAFFECDKLNIKCNNNSYAKTYAIANNISHTIINKIKEELEETGEDGWGDEVEETLEDVLDKMDRISYEVKRSRRGAYVDGDKVEDLVDELKEVDDMLTDAIDELEDNAERINESTLTEGPGAGYTITSSGYDVNGEVIDVRYSEVEDEHYTNCKLDCKVNLTGKVQKFNAEAAYTGTGDVQYLPIVCHHIYIEAPKGTLDDWKVINSNNEIDKTALLDLIIDDLRDASCSFTYGGGWSHATYDGQLTDDEWLDGTYYCDMKASIYLSNEEDIKKVDRMTQGYGYEVWYATFDEDGDEVDIVEDEDEAIEYAKKNNYSRVVRVITTTDWDGNEDADYDSIVWENEELFDESLTESSDEETPYTKEEVERDLKSITHNFTDKEGEVKCGFEEEKNFGVDILKQYYNVVEVREDKRGNTTWYHISFAEPIMNESKSIKEELFPDAKREALAKYLNVDVEDVVQTYDRHNFEVQSTGEEYIVADYDTAYELAEQDIRNLYDDLGMNSFTPKFQEWIMDYAVDEDWFKDALAESQRYYYEDMDEDEFIEECKENNISPDNEYAIDELVDAYLDGINDYPVEFRSIYGDTEFSNIVKEYDLVALDKVVEEAIRLDGIAHFIANYDGKEIELDDDLFAYRTN